MSFLGRLKRNIEKLEKNIEKEHEKINEFRINLDDHRGSRIEFNIKKSHIEEEIRAMDSHMRVLKG